MVLSVLLFTKVAAWRKPVGVLLLPGHLSAGHLENRGPVFPVYRTASALCLS